MMNYMVVCTCGWNQGLCPMHDPRPLVVTSYASTRDKDEITVININNGRKRI